MASFGLAGCASNPSATYQYHPPVLTVAVSATETVSCTADKTKPVYLVTTAVTPIYLSDPAQSWSFSIPHGSLSDVDFTPSFTDDGRLSSINSTLTGNGGTILKDLISLGVAIAAAGGGEPTRPLAVCNTLLKQPISIIYEAQLDFSKSIADETPLIPRPYLAAIDAALRRQIPTFPSFQAVIKSQDNQANRVTFAPSDLDGTAFAQLKLRPIRNAELQVVEKATDTKVYDSPIAIPEPGSNSYYYVAMPKPTLFGGSTFSLALSDSGAIKSIGYKTTNGTASAVEAATSAATAAAPQTPAEKAAQLKAQADVIAQQTRLAKCAAQPASCS
jgi:hypothetical protein